MIHHRVKSQYHSKINLYTHTLQGYRDEVPQDFMSVELIDGLLYTHTHTSGV